MTALDKPLDNLLALAMDRSREGREKLAETIGKLFANQERVLTEHEQALIIDILGKLVNDVEREVRQALARELATAETIPAEIATKLANDEIEVARPILLNSPVLKDGELIDIISHRSQQHQLSVALRSNLSTTISDALVNTGDRKVISTLLNNDNAEIADKTLNYLAEQSRRIDEFQEPLINRKDLPKGLAERMYWWVSAALRQNIIENFDLDIDVLDSKIQAGVHGLIHKARAETVEPPAAETLVERMKNEKLLTNAMLLDALKDGEIELFESIFAELSGFDRKGVAKVLYETRSEGIAIVCLSMGIPKQVFASIYLLSRKGLSGNHVTDPRELSRAMTLYDKINKEDAKRIANTWRMDPAYQDAIHMIEASIKDSGKSRAL
ncbi:DUF2336 domain-containing protein [Kiloniella sp. b19]|uniref:DUF2336 domain-containing protein n=1 Tax=Kiloniella sp. GXU_MW_B19 TaxID=3141326 RepID=UPI0031E088B4